MRSVPGACKLALSIDLSSPQTVGGLDTFDPVDPAVIAWWQKKVDEIYTLIPNFGGFTVKADSEGRVGPSKYGRTPADAANVLARALRPHGGVVLYRGFVYNNHLDWNDLKADRARAGDDNFASLDGKFEPNVVIQIKEGPIDFQVREPVSPLFAALRHTSEAIETTDHAGVHRPAAPHGLAALACGRGCSTPTCALDGRSTPVKEIVEGQGFHQPTGGFVRVVNVGLEPNWLHHPMAMANLYGFGKLAWNPDQPLPSRSSTRGRASPGATIQRSTPPSTTCSSTPGTSTRATPAPTAWARSPTSSATTSAPASRSPSATAGDSGSAARRTASAWTAP